MRAVVAAPPAWDLEEAAVLVVAVEGASVVVAADVAGNANT